MHDLCRFDTCRCPPWVRLSTTHTDKNESAPQTGTLPNFNRQIALDGTPPPSSTCRAISRRSSCLPAPPKEHLAAPARQLALQLRLRNLRRDHRSRLRGLAKTHHIARHNQIHWNATGRTSVRRHDRWYKLNSRKGVRRCQSEETCGLTVRRPAISGLKAAMRTMEEQSGQEFVSTNSTTGVQAHASPHLGGAKVCVKALFWFRNSWYFSTSGVKRCSGMLGMRS